MIQLLCILFVSATAVGADVHFVELINAANAIVRKHQRPSFNDKLPGIGVFHYTRRQTGGTTSFATCEDRARQERAHIFQELTFRRRRVTDDTNVNVPTQSHPFRRCFVAPTEQH